MNDAKKSIAKSIKAKPEEIIFTSGATESNNLAILGLAEANPDKRTVIISNIEHPSIIEPCEYLEKRGYKIIRLKTGEEGIINIKELERELTLNKDVLLVSIMHVNNVIGTIQPIFEAAELCRSKNILFHTDAVQSFGKLDIDVTKGIDLLSASGHKIGGPKGIGFLYVKNGIRIEPIIRGGGQEKGMRSGTENIPGIAGFAKALELTKKINKEKIEKLRDKLMSELENFGGRINGSKEKRIYNNVNVSFDLDAEMIVEYLSSNEVYVSVGSACESKRQKEAKGGVRVVLNEDVSDGDIKRVVKLFEAALRKLYVAGH
jgi:cysteine desulfurase